MALMSSLYTHTISTSRLAAGVGIQQTYQAKLTSVPCFIQPFTPEMAAKTNMVYGKSFNCYLDITNDVKEGDKVTDQNGTKYSVSGLMYRNYGGNPHLTLTLVKEENI